MIIRTKQLMTSVLLLIFAAVAGIWFAGGSVLAGGVAQGYVSQDSELVIGMAAATESGSTQNVVRASTSSKLRFVGIVTTKDSNLITLTSAKSNVVVTTSGTVNAYVSDINGVVKKGDFITVSPLKGVLMRATETETNIFASAVEDFPSDTASNRDIEETSGNKRTVKVASMLVSISPRNVTLGDQSSNSFLKTLGQNITGKAVSQWQVLVALVVFLMLLVVEGSLIYGAIRSSIHALGRNPLAKEAVYKQLLQVLLAVMAILAFGLATIYTVLQL